MKVNPIQIGINDRAFLVGSTGCGKTTLAQYLIEDIRKPYSVVYDAKISDSIGKWNHTYYYELDRLYQAGEKRLIYRPDIYEAQDANLQDEFFQWIYDRKHTRLYIDEAYALLGGQNPSFHLQACLSRGRERGISTIVSTQRPKRIPLITLSESEHIYVFRLNLHEDRIRIKEITGIDPEEQATIQNYEFIYFNALSGLRSSKLKLKINEVNYNGRSKSISTISI